MTDVPVFEPAPGSKPVGASAGEGARAEKVAGRPRARPATGQSRTGRAARRIQDEPAFLLHAIPYRETSLIVDLFTRDHGRISAVARGAKRPRSALRAVLMAFQPLHVTLTGDKELRNLVGAEWLGGLPAPQGDALLCAFYLNELLLKLLPREDAHNQLFDGYLETLNRLGHDEPLGPALRQFEWLLLRETGYGVDLRNDTAGQSVVESARYILQPGTGFMKTNAGTANAYSGRTLLDLAESRFDQPESLAEAKMLTRAILNHQLAGHALATRQILIDLQKL